MHIEEWLIIIVNFQQADAHNTTTTNKKLAVNFLEKVFICCLQITVLGIVIKAL